jgi:hypothetical protein
VCTLAALDTAGQHGAPILYYVDRDTVNDCIRARGYVSTELRI